MSTIGADFPYIHITVLLVRVYGLVFWKEQNILERLFWILTEIWSQSLGDRSHYTGTT